MIVRRAKATDAPAIAAIHVHAWQTAYQGIVPSAFLDSLSIEEREGRWRANLELRTSETWVAEENEEVVGWISAAGSRDPDSQPLTGEVWAMYVDPSCWRQGLGRRLLREAEGYLVTCGFSEVTLWVLEENTRAIAFYESNGLVADPVSQKTIMLGGAELSEIRLRKRLD
jgi:ribosomal protein S18 acetylase RimI-like enzyme